MGKVQGQRCESKIKSGRRVQGTLSSWVQKGHDVDVGGDGSDAKCDADVDAACAYLNFKNLRLA
jgi:hypothetical protein